MKSILISLLYLSCFLADICAQDSSLITGPRTGKILFIAQASHTDTEPLLSDSVFSSLYQIGKALGYEVIRSHEKGLFTKIEDIRAFDLLVSSDVGIEGLLDTKQKELFEAYILGDETHTGGNYLRLGYGDKKRPTYHSERDPAETWNWYQKLVQLEDVQNWATLDEWGDANLPTLQVQGLGTQTLGVMLAASSIKVLPHPYPGEDRQGAKVYSTVLGKRIEDYSRDKDGTPQNPILIEQLRSAIQWMLGMQDNQPPRIHHLDFSAVPDLDKVALSWETVWEEDNDFFEVHRAVGKTTWQTLNRLKAVGHSPQPCRYEYWDMNVRPGGYFYRIKQVDQHENSYFSDIVFVQIGQEQPLISLYPNPVRETLHVSVALKEACDFSIQIEDREGRMVSAQEVEALMADQASTIDLSHLSSGVYQVRLIAPEGEILQTFIKY